MIDPNALLLTGAQVTTLGTFVFYAMDLLVKKPYDRYVAKKYNQEEKDKSIILPLVLPSISIFLGSLSCVVFGADVLQTVGLIARYSTLGEILSGVPVALVSMSLYESKKALRTNSDKATAQAELYKNSTIVPTKMDGQPDNRRVDDEL